VSFCIFHYHEGDLYPLFRLELLIDDQDVKEIFFFFFSPSLGSPPPGSSSDMAFYVTPCACFVQSQWVFNLDCFAGIPLILPLHGHVFYFSRLPQRYSLDSPPPILNMGLRAHRGLLGIDPLFAPPRPFPQLCKKAPFSTCFACGEWPGPIFSRRKPAVCVLTFLTSYPRPL